MGEVKSGQTLKALFWGDELNIECVYAHVSG